MEGTIGGQQVLAAKHWWTITHDDSKYKDEYFTWLDAHTEASEK